MPSATISNVGFTAQFAPQIKRATATLSDGTVVMMVPDTNIAAQAGDDVTGTPKIRFYKSNAARTTWTLNFTYTPSPQAMSSTKAFVGSMVLDSSDNLHLVYQGTDNSLNYVPFTAGSGTWSAGTLQSVAASNAVTNRYRAIDIDVTSTNRPAIIVYESKASAGPSAWVRVYIRNDNGTTWRKAYEVDFATLAGGNIQIYTNSEDVSISWNYSGISSNVGQLLIYYTRVGFWFDHGDMVQEISYNVNTGTDGSATVVGSWPKFNQDTAAGTRRGWIFKTAADKWQVAMALGSAVPQFQSMRLTHNSFGAPVVDKTRVNLSYSSVDLNGVPVRVGVRVPQIDYSVNAYTAIGCVYADDRVMFGYLTSNGGEAGQSQFTISGTIFRYNNSTDTTASYIDSQMRALDNNFTYGSRPIGVYGGGNNRNQAGDLKFNFLCLYGYSGNTTGSAYMNKARAVIDTYYDPPTNVGPTQVSATDTPTLQARVQNGPLYPNVRGKIEWNLARDSAFTSDSRTIAEPDDNYRYFGSNNAAIPPPYNISLVLNGAGPQRLYSGTWYMRSRVKSDLGQYSSWSDTTTFSVSHPPASTPKLPTQGALVSWGPTGAVTFSWVMSDTEPTDVQTAYRLVVIRLDTGATVLDTGKTLSSVQSTTQTISSTYKELPLQWTVTLWDSDDVQGPSSAAVQFTAADAPVVRVTSPVAGTTVTTAAPSVGWSATFGAARTQKAYKASAYVVNAIDFFNRTVGVGGWGSTTDGKAYTVSGTASDYSVNGTLGVHSHSAVNTIHTSLLPASTYLDTDQTVSIAVTAVSAGAGAQRIGLIARYIDANNYLLADVQFNPDLSMGIRILSKVAGVETALTTMNPISGFVYSAGQRYQLRLKVSGTSVVTKIWVTGGTQPGYWHLAATNAAAALAVAGKIGMYSRIDTGTTTTLPATSTFENYFMYNSDNPATVGTSNWVQSTAAAHAFTTNILNNAGYYVVKSEVMDTSGLAGEDAIAIDTAWTAPVDGTSSVTLDSYGATISWTNTGIDINFVAWRVYRRYMKPALLDLDSDNSALLWEMIYETDVNTTSYSYKDYLIPNSKATSYVVVQVADRFGSLIESPISSYNTVTFQSDSYFFIPSVPIGTIASFQASSVNDDSFTDEIESEVLHVIGRGRQVQIGDNLGSAGSMSMKLRGPDARAEREFIQYLASNRTLSVWIRNPFGDVKCVKFLSVSVKFLAGTGTMEMSDISVPYVEVISDVPITRS